LKIAYRQKILEIAMSNQNNEYKNPPAQPEEVDESRRKLAGSALGVAAVFTLGSRPVWANQCTISGMMSGNLSQPKGPACAGCTPGYWRQPQHLDSWLATGFRPSDAFNTVFGVTAYVRPDSTPYTLLEVLQELQGNGDPISINLGFHAVAALLNAAHPGVNYGYEPGDIITLFINNIGTPGLAAKLKNSFVMLNQRGCPLT
jgi:hypothetical protein